MTTSPTGIRLTVYDVSSALDKRTGNFRGSVTLVGHYRRQDLWDAIVQRLDGTEFHKGGDLQSELIEILQGRIELLEKELSEKGSQDLERMHRAEQAASLASADKVRAEQHVQLLQSKLEFMTFERDSAVEAARRWGQFWADHQRICPLTPR